MLKSIFTIDDFPSGSYFYWVFSPYQKYQGTPSDFCYGKFKVVGRSNDFLLAVDISTQTNCIENISKEAIENYTYPKRIIVPEFIYQSLHNQPLNNLTEVQKIQNILLTGYTQIDEAVRQAKFTLDEFYKNKRIKNEA